MQLKRVLVTGASEGIGRAFAKRLALEGFAVTAVARNEKRLTELVAELKALAPNTYSEHSFVAVDLASKEGQARIASLLQSQHFELLINNAGIGTYAPFPGTDLEHFLK